MYEHSYHIDFGSKADDYVETFMKATRWANAERLFTQGAMNAATGDRP